jgi:uncharacterized Tic20 family protein
LEPEIKTPPTSDERNFAMLAHLLQLFGGFIAPLVIFVIKRDSRFVAFHALQALIWQLVYFAVAMIGMVAWFVLIFVTVAMQPHPGPSNGPPIAIFILFPLIWLFFAGGWLLTLILGIVYGIKANKGEWARYPIIGGWALKLARA